MDSQRQKALLDAICDDILETTDLEIWEDYKSAGLNPVRAALEARAVIRKALDNFITTSPSKRDDDRKKT